VFLKKRKARGGRDPGCGHRARFDKGRGAAIEKKKITKEGKEKKKRGSLL